jgi:hypothetical protein
MKLVSSFSSESYTYRIEYQVWIAGNKLRYDQIVRESSRTDETAGNRKYFCRNCEIDGYALSGSQNDKTYTSVGFVNLSVNAYGRQNDIDWRIFGLYPGFINDLRLPDPIAKKRYNALVDNPKGHSISFANSAIDSRTIHIKYLSGIDTFLSIDVAHLRPTSVRINDNKGYTESYDMTYNATVSTVFPAKMVCQIVRNGSPISSETIDVESVSLNPRIDDKVFTFSGLGLKDGTPIDYPHIKDPNKFPIWRNGQVDNSYTTGQMGAEMHSKMTAATATPDIPAPSLWSRSWPYLVGASVLAFVGFLLLRRMRKQPA